MYSNGVHKLRMFFKFIITLIPIAAVLWIIDTIAKTHYNTSLYNIIKDFFR